MITGFFLHLTPRFYFFLFLSNQDFLYILQPLASSFSTFGEISGEVRVWGLGSGLR